MTATKLTWVKTGERTGPGGVIVYEAGRYKIIITRICGEWGRPSLYRDDRHVKGFQTVREAKAEAERMANAQ